MPAGHHRSWTDRAYLRERQYRTDANLAARQSVYAWQRPRQDIARLVIDLAGLDGGELVTDVGCGNGAYLAELGRRGHPGPVLGLDLSPGMLRAARSRAPAAALAVADAAALPLPDQAGDVTLAAHMLYHLPEPAEAVRELRRVTRPGGRVLVGLNGDDHFREVREALDQALAGLGLAPPGTHDRLTLDHGERLLAGYFGTVVRHDFTAELLLPEPGPVADYVRSMRLADQVPDPERLVAGVLARLPADSGGLIRITTHSGCLVCS